MKKTNKTGRQRPLWKTALIFGAVFVGCFLLGMLAGGGAAALKNMGVSLSLSGRGRAAMVYGAPALFVLIWLAAAVVCAVYFQKAKSLFAGWDGESDGPVRRAEALLSRYILITNCLLILSMCLFAVWAWADSGTEGNWPLAGVFIALFIAGLVAVTLMQRAAVELEKRINPEKRGEVLDFRFQKTWQSSLDEGELLNMYKAGHKAFKTVNRLCLGLWVVCTIGEITFSLGVMPALCVSLIWLASTVAFQVEGMRLERGREDA